MKIKNLLLALFALPLLFVACDKDNPVVDDVKEPTVAVTAGVATDSTITFTVASTDAEKVAYLVVEGTNAPTASEVLANGTEVEVNKSVEVTATELKAETEYTIVAAAQNSKAVVKATASKTTLKAGEKPADDFIALKSASEMSFSSDGGNGEIAYEIVNTVPGANVSATTNAAWINDVVVDEKVTFVVAANDGAAREAKITVSYHNDSFDVVVKQAAVGGAPTPDAWVASHFFADFDDSEDMNIYAIMLGDKDFGNNGWGVDGGTYYTLYFVSASKGGGKLPKGTYVLESSYSAGTIIVDYSYRHTMENGQLKYGMEIFSEANLIISDGKIEFNAVMDRDGSVVKVVYEGDLSVDDGSGTTPPVNSDFVATEWIWAGSSSYGNKYVVSGENFSIDIHFQPKNANENSIVAGEYTWTNTSWWGYNDFEEFTTRNFTVDGESDLTIFRTGYAVVSNNGDEYHIEFTLADDNGAAYSFVYDGKIGSGTQGGSATTLNVKSLGAGSYNSSYYFYTFKAAGDNFSFDLAVNDYQAKDTTINAGDYTCAPSISYAGNKNLFYVNNFKYNGVSYKPTEASKMKVEGDGTNVVITMDLTMQSGDKFTVKYNGKVGGSSDGGGSTELTKLATPSVSGIVSGNAATVSWNEIAGAKDYTVTLNGTDVKTVTTAYIVYQDLAWETTYSVSVVANPADSAVNSASDAGTATFTTEANPNGGDEGGNTGGVSFENWAFSASLDMGAKAITVTDGSHTVVFTINEVAGGTFYIFDNGVLNITKVVVNGEETTDASGTVEMSSNNNYYITLDATINGVKYTGTSSNAVI